MAPSPSPASIALNRFGLGARPDDVPPGDPKRWLLDQFDRYDPRPPAFAALPDGTQLAAEYFADQMALAEARKQAKAAANDPKQDAATLAARKDVNAGVREAYRAATNARMASALATETPFVERLVHFWANHFALSADKPQVTIFAGAYEMEAIRPHVLGRFEDMLLAVERHPAMLYYLDQFRSVGPDSRAGLRAAQLRPDRPLGLNENLAREIMELHTLGVRTGYAQADVTEFARALTGWSIGGKGPGAGPGGDKDDGALGRFQFRPNIHEPGTRTILGKAYSEEGEGQAKAVLHRLATSPATAKHVSTKLARHFVADDPPPALVDRMTAAFLKHDGDLTAVYRVLIAAPESWAAVPTKFKSPWEWTVSSMRGLGRRDLGQTDIAPMQNQLGQPVWRPGSPAGYDDIAATWASPDALMRRVELAQRFASTAGDRIDARALAPKLMPAAVSPATTTALAQAESGATALALLLVSPEFQRR
ncbi:DUF1800 domain-containing protein [Sphingomonas sp. AP4-R1]|uniref:DUF1800 domain-containing protein n=1 Tax=Sphingomonas sp. AP4-R1 TaxID=2735134 RepID=UPI0014936894|nr:DUF1800 domain-containing protein [Sphingomonas sp. AP4-R1]QJU58967.1 DUF1800 domain-containing protein [Sphingomonas sp. AP4-R1]